MMVPIGCHCVTPFQGHCYVTLLYMQFICYLIIRYKLLEHSCTVWQLKKYSGHSTRGITDKQAQMALTVEWH